MERRLCLCQEPGGHNNKQHHKQLYFGKRSYCFVLTRYDQARLLLLTLNEFTAMSALAKSQKKKAEEYKAEAEKTIAKKSWFSSSKERNQEDAAELYLQAANAYKVGGLSHEAGEMYTKAGEIYRDFLKNPNQSAKAFSDAGK